jgi:hypothetical protein
MTFPAAAGASGDELAARFASFEQRFPSPPGWQPIDVRELPIGGYGLRLIDYMDVENPAADGIRCLPALHAQRGQRGRRHRARWLEAEEARHWCRNSLKAVFATAT